jgi:hypothetical protein
MRLFADNATFPLASAIVAGDTTITLTTGEGAKYPSPTGGDFFDVTLTQALNESSWEIVKCTARTGDSLTVVRGQYGTTAAGWDAGDKAQIRAHKAVLDGFVTLGKTFLGNFPAGSMKPQTTNGCASLAWAESTTNKVMTGSLNFDAAVIEYAQFSFKSPKGLDETAGFYAVFEWNEAASATTHDVVWGIEIQAQGDGDTIDSAWGTLVTVTDTGASGLLQYSPETSVITAGGTWSAGDDIVVRVSRQATNGSDTLNVDAKLSGVTLYATYASLIEV